MKEARDHSRLSPFFCFHTVRESNAALREPSLGISSAWQWEQRETSPNPSRLPSEDSPDAIALCNLCQECPNPVVFNHGPFGNV